MSSKDISVYRVWEESGLNGLGGRTSQVYRTLHHLQQVFALLAGAGGVADLHVVCTF